MKIKVMLTNGIMPTRAHEDDAGLDLYTPKTVTVPGSAGMPSPFLTSVNIGHATIDTGVHIEIPKGYVGFVKSKSGLNIKHGLTAEGVIDAGYTGSICVKLYNHTIRDYTFKEGEKIAQLVLLPIITPTLRKSTASKRQNEAMADSARQENKQRYRTMEQKGKVFLSEHICPICGKIFFPTSLHVYRSQDDKPVCSWSCVLRSERESEGKKKKKGDADECS